MSHAAKFGPLLLLCVGVFVCLVKAGQVTISDEILIDSPVVDMKWINSTDQSDKIVFLKSQKGTLYRSSDGGATWVNQVDKLSEARGESLGVATIASITFSPTTGILWFRGLADNNWVTKDSGESYQFVSKGVSSIKLHPSEREWLLASAEDKVVDDKRLKALLLSKDLGSTWEKLVSNVVVFGWLPLGFAEPNAILACVHEPDMDVQGRWDPNIHLYKSTDFFATQDLLMLHGNRFVIYDNFLFVATVNPLEVRDVSLHISTDGGQKFRKAHFPYKLTEHSYSVLDTSEEAVFLHVNHADGYSSSGSVYSSDSTGAKFTLSLKNAVRVGKRADFARVKGVDGVYLANIALSETSDNSGGLSSLRASAVRRSSVITFDKGGEWKKIQPPKKNSKGEDIGCEGCSLHLHGRTSTSRVPFYSSETSAGIILASGNVGTELGTRDDEVNTYFSRDAGLTWSEVAQGSHIYEVGDHGALTILVNNNKATNKILYSWNEGLEWSELQISDNAFEVSNVITEPRGTSQMFIVYGTKSGKGALVHIDFSSLHTAQCKNIDAAGTADSDYEHWAPHESLREGSCLLGQQVTYTRRKREASCYNGYQFERRQFVKFCACQASDFECDYGYQRDGDNSCFPIDDSMPDLGIPEDCEDFYYKTKGYRKIPGDKCTGRTDLSPRRVACPRNAAAGVLLVFFMIVLALGAFLYAYAQRNGKGFSIQIMGKHLDLSRPAYHFQPLQTGATLAEFDDDDEHREALAMVETGSPPRVESPTGDEFDPRA